MKPLDIKTIKENISNSIKTISNMFDSLLSKDTNKDTKRASLISYWLKDYSNYITSEDSFDPKSLLRYKRGSVVQVEFGYRVGRELGGRHYAVVIDVKNDFGSGTITVVPLSSLKETSTSKRYSFLLKKGLYELYTDNIRTKQNNLRIQINKLREFQDITEKEYISGNIGLKEFEKRISTIKKNHNELDVQIAILNRDINKLNKLKLGTIVNVDQVITISKMRISNPKTSTDSLSGIRLSKNDLDTLNEKLKELYIY